MVIWGIDYGCEKPTLNGISGYFWLHRKYWISSRKMNRSNTKQRFLGKYVLILWEAKIYVKTEHLRHCMPKIGEKDEQVVWGTWNCVLNQLKQCYNVGSRDENVCIRRCTCMRCTCMRRTCMRCTCMYPVCVRPRNNISQVIGFLIYEDNPKQSILDHP